MKELLDLIKALLIFCCRYNSAGLNSLQMFGPVHCTTAPDLTPLAAARYSKAGLHSFPLLMAFWPLVKGFGVSHRVVGGC